MWIARFLAGLVIVFVAHLVGAAITPRFGDVFDLFVVLIVLVAARGDEVGGMVCGAVTGLARDALLGDLYGLNGFAGTVVGFGTARAARQLTAHEASVVGLLALGAQPLFDALIALLQSLLIPEARAPELGWLAIRALTTASLAFLIYHFGTRTEQRLSGWQRTRKRRIKID